MPKLRRLLILPGVLLFIILIFIVTYSAWQQPTSTSRRSHTVQPWPTVPKTPFPDNYYFAAIDPGLEAALMSDQSDDGLAVAAAGIPPIGAYLPGSQQLEFPTPTPRPRPATATPSPSNTPTASWTSTPTATATATASATASQTPSHTPTMTLTATPSPTLLPSVTPSLTPTFTPTPSVTLTPTHTATASHTPTATVSHTPSPTATFTPSYTAVATAGPVADLSRQSGSIFVTQTADECAPAALPVGGVLTQRFHTWHWGIDIGVYLGTPIPTTHSGEIMYAGWSDEGYGYLVIVQSGVFSTYYAHLSALNVEVGQTVERGMVIGWSGSTGNSSGPHLHYEIRVNNIPLDPLTFEQRGYISC